MFRLFASLLPSRHLLAFCIDVSQYRPVLFAQYVVKGPLNPLASAVVDIGVPDELTGQRPQGVLAAGLRVLEHADIRDLAHVHVNYLARQIDKRLVPAQLALNKLGPFITQGCEVGGYALGLLNLIGMGVKRRGWDIYGQVVAAPIYDPAPTRFQFNAALVLLESLSAVRLVSEELDLDEACG